MLIACLAATCAAALAAPLLGRHLGRAAGWPLAAWLLAVGIVVALVSQTGATSASAPWMPTAGIDLALRLDGLSSTFALLVLVIGAIVMAYSASYLGPGSQGAFYGLMTLFAAAMLMLVLADDVVVLFVAWEATTLCSFFLISRSGPRAREPAVRTLLVTAMGGLSLLAAVVVMAVKVGSTRLSVILTDPIWAHDTAFTATVAMLLALAVFTKSAQFPFQAWLPDSMVAVTPVSAYLHAAAMVKAGIYLLFRFSPVLADVTVWKVLLIVGGLLTAVFGAVAALRRFDLKELLAYSTMSQLGLLVATIGVGTPQALTAATVHTVAHALFKAALFLLVGNVDHRVGTRDIRHLSGLRRRMPVTATLTALAAASMAGVPPLLGFVSKESLFAAFWAGPGEPWVGQVLAGTVAAVAMLTFAYSARIVLGAFGGPPTSQAVTDVRARSWVPTAVPAVGGLVLGLAPFLLDGLVARAASATVSASAGDVVRVHLTLWHGVTPAFVLSVAVLAVGTSLVVGRRRVESALARVRAPVSGLDVVDGARAGTIRLGEWVAGWMNTSAPRRHLMIPVACVVAIALVGSVVLGDLPPVEGDVVQRRDWGLVMLVAAGVLGGVAARTRIAAIVVTGVVGFAMTLWFFSLGAADVALTQLLVEVLTVVVMVLLLRRLPSALRRGPRRQRVGPALLALGAGVATTIGVLGLTGRRDMSAAGDYFVREAEAATGGTNVVNTILVDFRALDTLGELTVLGVAGVAIAVLLRSRQALPSREPEPTIDQSSPLAHAGANAVFIGSLTRLVGPLAVVSSVVLLMRGHQEPGGGFIAALMGGAAFALLYLSAPSDAAAKVRWPYLVLIGAGVVIGTATGFLGYRDGSFLRPLHADLLGAHLTTALLFDVGVYLAVIGVVLASLNLLGLPRPGPRPGQQGSATTDEIHVEEAAVS